MIGSVLLDSNILIRLVQPDSHDHEAARFAVERLNSRSITLFYTMQNLAEFWNVCTRPASANGIGMSVADTDELATWIESKFKLLDDHQAAYTVWRKLLLEQRVSGIQVHDARLAAAVEAIGLDGLLTFNIKDFRRFPRLRIFSPHEVTESYP